jgi:hypothetical protein
MNANPIEVWFCARENLNALLEAWRLGKWGASKDVKGGDLVEPGKNLGYGEMERWEC